MSNIRYTGREPCACKGNDIIVDKSTYQNHIKHLLDKLLDFCFDESILLLFRKLCRYYLNINPIATADNINFSGKFGKKMGRWGLGRGKY